MLNSEEYFNNWKTNRIKAKTGRSGKPFWCGCDRNLVRDQEKCCLCRRKNGKFRWKLDKKVDLNEV